MRLLFIVLSLILADFRDIVESAVPSPDEPVREVDLQWLTDIEWEEGQELPARLRALDGQRVVVRGSISAYTLDGSPIFLLVRAGCDCEGRPKVQHFVEVTLKRGGVRTGPEPRRVLGRISVGAEYKDGFVASLFRLDGAELQ